MKYSKLKADLMDMFDEKKLHMLPEEWGFFNEFDREINTIGYEVKLPEEIIEKVKEQHDIVDVVSDVVRLKRAGRNFSGLCPFHNEKSPSFSVSPDKQIFKCFGCGEAGNVISFVMKTKNLNFVDAVKELADRANIIIPIEDGKQSESQKKKQVLYKINKQDARYYFSNLQNNKEAKEYFLRRGIKENILNILD